MRPHLCALERNAVIVNQRTMELLPGRFPPVTIPRFFRELSKNALVREHPWLPCAKGAGMAVSRKAMTEGLLKGESSDPLSQKSKIFASSPWSARGALALIRHGYAVPPLRYGAIATGNC